MKVIVYIREDDNEIQFDFENSAPFEAAKPIEDAVIGLLKAYPAGE